MTMDAAPFSFLALAGLGALHGVNPGMGWLFAVGLGLQRQERSAVWRALGPLALGHALAVAAAVTVMLMIGQVVPASTVRILVGVGLVGMGLSRLVRHRHARYGGMQVNARQLTIWSFLMASGHGAGLMVLPFLSGESGSAHAHHGPALASIVPAIDTGGLVATLIHTGGYLLVTGLIAVIVYEKLGLRLLRKAWINVDLVWAGVLVVTGIGVVVA